MNDEDWLSSIEEAIRKSQWITAAGNYFTISSMDTSHIINCQNFIKRNSLDISYSVFNEYLELFSIELERRNNYALYTPTRTKTSPHRN